MKNSRSISNLPFINKVIEKVGAMRKEEHLVTNDLHQSVYRTTDNIHRTVDCAQ